MPIFAHWPAKNRRVWTGYLLNHAAERIRGATVDILAPIGVTPPLIRVLEAIAVAPGLSQVRLGAMVHMDRTTIVHMIDRLEMLDAARRIPDRNDRRS